MKCLILTAGKGTRLRPYTEIWPKPAIPFLNIPLYYYSCSLFREWGAEQFVFNLHHLPEKMRLCIDRGPIRHKAYSLEKDEILGGGGALKKAWEHFRGEEIFGIANGDTLLVPGSAADLQSFLKAHVDSKPLATLLVTEHEEAGKSLGAVWADSSRRVLGFGKSNPKPGDATIKAWHFTGVLLSGRQIEPFLPEGVSNLLYDVLQAGILQGQKVLIHPVEAAWFETGNKQDFLTSTETCIGKLSKGSWFLEKVYREYFDAAPKDFLIESGALRMLKAPGADLDEPGRVKGFIVLGEDSWIGKAAQVENAVIGPGVSLEEKCHIQNDIVLK